MVNGELAEQQNRNRVGPIGVVLGMLLWLVVVVPLIGVVSQSWADTIAAADLDAPAWG